MMKSIKVYDEDSAIEKMNADHIKAMRVQDEIEEAAYIERILEDQEFFYKEFIEPAFKIDTIAF